MVHDMYEITTAESGMEYSTAPNGIVGISIILSGHSRILLDHGWQQTPAFSVYGLVKKPDVIQISPHFREIAIGFKPYFLQLLLKDSMAQIIRSGGVDANDIFNRFELEMLKEKISFSMTDFQIMAAVEEFILKQLHVSKVNARLLTAMNLVYDDGYASVKEIAERVNLSTTSIRNLFHEGIGRSPKEVMAIRRIHKILKYQPKPNSNLTTLSYQSGYFDQAHFIHDFRETMGMTPGKYFTDSTLAFDFYNFGRWKGNIFAGND